LIDGLGMYAGNAIAIGPRVHRVRTPAADRKARGLPAERPGLADRKAKGWDLRPLASMIKVSSASA